MTKTITLADVYAMVVALQKKSDAQEKTIAELKKTAEGQKKTIDQMRAADAKFKQEYAKLVREFNRAGNSVNRHSDQIAALSQDMQRTIKQR